MCSDYSLGNELLKPGYLALIFLGAVTTSYICHVFSTILKIRTARTDINESIHMSKACVQSNSDMLFALDDYSIVVRYLYYIERFYCSFHSA